jgi:UDP-N-acetylmuramyl pentapeptide synthase
VSKKINKVVFVGPEFQKANAAVGASTTAFTNVYDLKAWFEREKPTNYTILLKGSRGMALEKLLEK